MPQPLGEGDHRQEGVAEHALAGLEALLHSPTRPGHLHQSDQGQAGRAGAHVDRQLPAAQVAADQQPAAPPVRRTVGGKRTRVQAYQRRPLAQSPALQRSQRSGGTRAASSVAGVGGPVSGWSVSVHRTARTDDSRLVSSQARKLALMP